MTLPAPPRSPRPNRRSSAGLPPSAAALLPVAALALLPVAFLPTGCGGSGAANAPSPDAAAADAAPTATDPVLGGRWEAIAVADDFDFPNRAPALDVRDGTAHFLFNAKTGETKYRVVRGAEERTTVPFPQGTKDTASVTALPDGSSVVVLVRQFDGASTAHRQRGGALTALPAPAGPLGSVDVAALGQDAVLGAVAAATGAAITVQRLGADRWTSFGDFPARASPIARVRLAADGARLALASLEGSSTRIVRVWSGGAWTELGGLPASEGDAGLVELAIVGGRVFFLEFQERPQQSVLWVHDGAGWSEWARSARGDALHGLAIHGGVPYSLWAKSPNLAEAATTYGVARLDRGAVTKGAPAVPDDARFDVMVYEESHLVARDGAMWLAYLEGGSTPIAHLLRLVPAAAR